MFEKKKGRGLLKHLYCKKKHTHHITRRLSCTIDVCIYMCILPSIPNLLHALFFYLSSAVRLANGNAFFSLPAIFFLLRSIALSTWLFFMLANCSTSSCFFCSLFLR